MDHPLCGLMVFRGGKKMYFYARFCGFHLQHRMCHSWILHMGCFFSFSCFRFIYYCCCFVLFGFWRTCALNTKLQSLHCTSTDQINEKCVQIGWTQRYFHSFYINYADAPNANCSLSLQICSNMNWIWWACEKGNNAIHQAQTVSVFSEISYWVDVDAGRTETFSAAVETEWNMFFFWLAFSSCCVICDNEYT